MATAAPDPDDFGRVYRAVKAGQTAEEVREIIEDCAQGSKMRRKEAVNAVPRGKSDSDTALARAHKARRSDLVGLLLEAGADVRPLGPKASAVALCIKYDLPHTLRVLLKSGEHDANAPIFLEDWASWSWKDEGGADEDGCDFFCTAVHLCLLPDYPDIGASSPSPRLECLKVLAYAGGADVSALDKSGAPPLSWVAHASSSHLDAVKLLLKLGADPVAKEAGQFAPVVQWCRYRFGFKRGAALVPCLRRLVAAGAPTSRLGPEASPPVYLAAGVRSVEAVRYLVEEEKVDVNERDPDTGETALHNCTFGARDDEIARLLVDAGADLEIIDHEGKTAIFLAAQSQWPATLELLLARGASPDVKDGNGATTLMAACSSSWRQDEYFSFASSADTAALLVRHSSRETCRAVRRSDGFSALDCIVDMLREDEDMLMEEYWEEMAEEVGADNLDGAASPPLHALLKQPQRQLIVDLMAAGVPFLPASAGVLLPILMSSPLIRRPDQIAALLRARRSESNRWRAHDDLVGLAFDHQELRQAEEAVARKKRRVEELEAAVGGGEEEEQDDSLGDETWAALRQPLSRVLVQPPPAGGAIFELVGHLGVMALALDDGAAGAGRRAFARRVERGARALAVRGSGGEAGDGGREWMARRGAVLLAAVEQRDREAALEVLGELAEEEGG